MRRNLDNIFNTLPPWVFSLSQMTDRNWYFHFYVLGRVRAAIILIQEDLMLLHSARHVATPLLGGSLGGTFISFLASQFLCCLFGKILVFAPRLPARESAVSRHQQQTSAQVGRRWVRCKCSKSGDQIIPIFPWRLDWCRNPWHGNFNTYS